jgi:hypothetical protein
MADENDKGKPKTPAAGGPPRLDRRDLLKGLSTVPALGLFGYAWSRQQAHRAGVEARAASPRAAQASARQMSPVSRKRLVGRAAKSAAATAS